MNRTVLASFMILCLLSTAILTKFKSGNCVLTDNEGTGFREIKPESYTCEGDLGQLTTNCSNAFDSDWSTKLEWDKSCTSGDFVIVLIENYSLPTSLTYVNWEFKAYHNNTGSLMPSPMTIHCWNGSSWKIVYVLDDTDHVNEVFAERITMPPEAFVKGRLSIMTSIKYSSHWVMTGPLWHYVEYFEGKPNLIIVDDDNIAGPWDGTAEHPYQNITSGLEHASANDTVFVHAGTYYEHVSINKSISLIGENRCTTFIDGNGTGTAVSIYSNFVIFRGFTVQNSGFFAGLPSGLEMGCSNCTIINNIIASNKGGIALLFGGNHSITNNTISSNYYGVSIVYSVNNKIFHNYFLNNTNQAYSTGAINTWDNGYPSGGNYWDDYVDVDQFSGVYQNESGSDGKWDHPYEIDENNVDNYPIVPEFPSFLILPLFMIATLLAAIVYKRKHWHAETE